MPNAAYRMFVVMLPPFCGRDVALLLEMARVQTGDIAQ
jgi:hypothetical protein